MRKKFNRSKRGRKAILYFVIAAIALAGVTPVLADYLGPNRTVTETVGVCKVILYECQYVSSKNIWKDKIVDNWSCANESKPWKDFPSKSLDCNSSNAGYTYWEKEDAQQQVINTYPPATINGFLDSCTQNNGWCTNPAQLSLNGVEPVSGYNIIAIEGTLNGETFACPNSTCNVPLREGNNDFTYWALSSWGDSSIMGTLSAKVDSLAPAIVGTLNGTSGSNGWYLSPVTFTGSASDNTSGLANFTCALDGVSLASCSSITINGEGPHTLALTAQDNAGNTRTLTQSPSLDSQNPTLTASISGTNGSNSWYTAAALTALASDPTPGSGLSAIEYNLDGSAWVTFPASGELILPEGQHTLTIRAIDYAGRTASSSKSFSLDSTAPSITLDPVGAVGANNWYISDLTLQASAADNISGMDIFDYSLDGSAWTSYASSLLITNGSHTISFWAQDKAGLATQVDRVYRVDTRPPQIAGSISGTPGTNNWYVSDVTLSASAADPLPGSGMDAFTYILNGATETPYTNALVLSDGQHIIKLNAKDKAGLTYSKEQIVKVDTIHPSLSIHTTLPNWIKDAVTLNGTAGDSGSGLSKVEISTDGGQTWTPVIGAASWSYDWNTRNNTNGTHNVRVRSTDMAGLTTEKIISAGVDNNAPKISLPDSWYQWDTVQLDAWDNDSGLSGVYVEISDPQGRWQKRTIQLDPEQFPVNFKWDRRFGDGTVAPLGTYDLNVFAFDNMGNSARKSASVKILLGILPAGPTSTPQISIRTESTSTPIYTATSIPSPTLTPTAVVSVFGDIEPTVQATSTPAIQPTPRATPTQSKIIDWLESILVPASDATDRVMEITSDEPQAADSTYPQSNVLWGSSAAAMVGAVTGYALEERRRRQEEEAARRVSEAEEEERREKAKARHVSKLEAQHIQEQVWEQERLNREALDLVKEARLAARVTKTEVEEHTQWVNSLIETRENWEEKKKAEELKAGLEAYYNARKQGEQDAPKPEPNWWDKTKSFVGENIIQPVNDYIYQPYAKPIIDSRNKLLKGATSWLDKNIYQPHLKSGLENIWQFTKKAYTGFNENVLQPLSVNVGEAVISGLGWTNEKIYQPLIKPWVDHNLEVASRRIKFIDEKIYQPFIKPAVEVINETIVQPYVTPFIQKNVAPLVQNAAEGAVALATLVDKKIYEPIFAPVVNDISKYIVQPLIQKVTNWWGQYGEWVHGALDLAGFIPGLGDIGDGLNGLIYLCEGRYLEAGISAISAIPLLGYLGSSGKLVMEAGQEVVDTVVGKVAKEIAGETIEKLAKESLEEGAEKAILETTQQLARIQWVERALDMVGCVPGAGNASTTIKGLIQLTSGHYLDATMSAISMIPIAGPIVTTGKEILQSSLQRVIKETAEELSEKIVKESVEAELQFAAKEMSEEVVELIAKEGGEELIEQAAKETLEEVAEKVVKETVEEVTEEVVEKTTKEVFQEALENTAKQVQKEVREDASKVFIEKVTGENTSKDVQEITEDPVTKEAVDEIPQRVDKTQFVESLKEQYGDEMVDRFLPFCEKYGIDPYDVLTRPPAEGQTLIGWGLGIANPENPANHSLVELKLTKDELNSILEKSTVRSDSKVVVLGFGSGEKPYFALSDEIEGCHLSLSNDAWVPFDKARANFLVDVNMPFVEKRIEERKIFIFNVEYDVITNPRNVQRFSLPELRLLEMEKNNYVQVPVGKYSAFVPKESLDTFAQDLPASLFESGEQE